MGVEEDVEQFGIADDVRIINNAHGFGMTGGAAAHLFIVGHVLVAADIAGFNRFDALQFIENCFGAPETAAGNDGDIMRHIYLVV